MLSYFGKSIFIVFTALTCSCSHTPSKSEVQAFKILNVGIANSTLTIFKETQAIYHTLENKQEDPATRYKAVFWLSKAMKIQQLSVGMFDYIQNLRSELLKGVGFSQEHPFFDETDKDVVNTIFNKQGKGTELFQQLSSYKNSMLHIDPSLYEEFKTYSLIPEIPKNGTENDDDKEFVFQDISIIAALTVLNQFQNTVRTFENKMATFCNQQCTNNAFILDVQPSPIVSQSSKYLKNGDELEVIAGLATFETRKNLKITIDYKQAEVGDYGYSDFKLKITSKPGVYNIPIKIEYNDQDGNRKRIDRNVKYTVLE